MKCEQCIHKNVCKYGENRSDGLYCTGSKCKQFQDKSKWVELPCKVGDTVYKLSYDCVKGIRYNPFNEYGASYAELCLKCNTYPCNLHKAIIQETATSLEWIIKNTLNGSFGETVFLTKQAVESALKARAGDE